jgi:hypothetical protein
MENVLDVGHGGFGFFLLYAVRLLAPIGLDLLRYDFFYKSKMIVLELGSDLGLLCY